MGMQENNHNQNASKGETKMETTIIVRRAALTVGQTVTLPAGTETWQSARIGNGVEDGPALPYPVTGMVVHVGAAGHGCLFQVAHVSLNRLSASAGLLTIS
jgi:hypothetical protein